MIIENYGIRLKKIGSEDLEILRNWRNSDFVNSRMIATAYITPEMQSRWFETINNEQNYYFVAECKGEKVGMIHVKNIKNNNGEGGIFLASEKYENTDLVPRMVLCFNDFIFEDLQLDFIYCQVKADNKKAISSCIAQGCVLEEAKSTTEILSFRLLPENYQKKVRKIKSILNKQK